MPDMLSDGAVWLGDVLTEHAQRTVSIQQGTQTHSAIDCWCDLTGYEVVDSEGFGTTVESWDWRFVIANLPDDFVFRPGDVIAETRGTTVRKYEAMPIAQRPCAEDLDSAGNLLTVHTKRVE
jgi:hypothetical protein